MINGHMISIESKGSVFNYATFFNINACSCNGDVLMNLNVLNAWYNGINNIIYAIKSLSWSLNKGNNQGVLTWEMHSGPPITSIVVLM
jgi:hypothetical protein